MEGWIKLHRKSLANFLYTENRPHTKREAWEDLLLKVNHTEQSVLIGVTTIQCDRGQSVRSLDSWAKDFNWSKSRVLRFFRMLQKCSMIRLENVQKSTRLTICNYEDYQGERNDSETIAERQRNDNDIQTRMKRKKEDISCEMTQKDESSFLKFWNLYQKKCDRAKCEAKWKKLKPDEVKAIFQTLPSYIDSTPDVTYRKNPLTYLNGKCWNDEVNNSKNKNECKPPFKSIYPTLDEESETY